LDEISDEKQQRLVQGEQLYRADDPAFDSLRDELARDPETAYWLTHMLVFDLVVAWQNSESNDQRLFQSVLGKQYPAVERALRHVDAMGEATIECLVEVVVHSELFQTRTVGVILLARVGEPALPALREMAREPVAATRRLAAQVLTEMAEPVPEGNLALVRVLVEDSDYTVRAEAVKGLARGGETDADLMRRILLTDPDPYVQRTSATEILAFPDLATAAALIQYMEMALRLDDSMGVDAADASLRRLAGRRQSGDLATWKEWLRSVSGTGGTEL
jgi:hypothetical protein